MTALLAALLLAACLVAGGLWQANRSGQPVLGGFSGVFSLDQGYLEARQLSGSVPLPGDTAVYLRDARFLETGRLPYRDFVFEYPPLALPLFWLPKAIGGTQHYALAFLGLMAVFAGGLGATIAQTARALGRAPLGPVLIAAGLVLIASPTLAWRFDLAPATLTALGALALVRGQAGRAGLWWGLGVAVKLYPVVLLPAVVLACGWRAVPRFLAAFAAAAFLPAVAVLAWGANPAGFLAFNGGRALQVESFLAGLALAWHGLTGTDAGVLNGGYSFNLTSALAMRLLPLAVPLLLALYAAVLAAVRPALLGRTRLAPAAVLNLGLALLVALLLGNKVFSPQYLAWLLPFAAFAPPVPAALVAAATAATTWIYPLNYPRLVRAEGWAIAALNLRNGLLLAVLVALVVWLARRPAGDPRSRSLTRQRA